LRRRGLLMIHLGCEKGLERPFSLFCHFRAAQAFELGKLPPDRWHRGEIAEDVAGVAGQQNAAPPWG
jgi:hypothetical protein